MPEAEAAALEMRDIFGEDFLDYLRNFKFSGEIYAVEEGTPVFPREPLIRVKAPIMEAQLMETALLKRTEIKYEGQEFIIVKQEDILAIVE